MVPTAPAEAMEAGGMLKVVVRWRFMEAACLMNKVELCAMTIPLVKEVSQMGITLRISFVSSTLVNVDSLHGLMSLSSTFLSSIIAALSRHLSRVTLHELYMYICHVVTCDNLDPP